MGLCIPKEKQVAQIYLKDLHTLNFLESKIPMKLNYFTQLYFSPTSYYFLLTFLILINVKNRIGLVMVEVSLF